MTEVVATTVKLSIAKVAFINARIIASLDNKLSDEFSRFFPVP